MQYSWAIMIIVLIGCLKPDKAPVQVPLPKIDPYFTTVSISTIRNMATYTGTVITDSSWMIKGVVIGNDIAGNLYKQIYIQDATGGIAVKINNVALYSQFPLGRIIYIKLYKSYIWANYGPIQINGGIDYQGDLIAFTTNQIPTHFIFGQYDQPISIAKISVQDLNHSVYKGTLVKLNDMQVVSADTGLTYSIPNYYSIRLENNNTPRDTIYLNVNTQSAFALLKVPTGSGSIVGIYDTSTSNLPIPQPKQIFIREINDIQFTNARF